MTSTRPRKKDVTYELVAGPAGEDRAEAPLALLRRVLRGRYRLFATCAATLAVFGAIAGYFVKPPRYESSGLIVIESNHAPLLHNYRESRDPSEFEAFISAQVARLQSRRVLDAALSQPEMAGAGWPRGEAGLAQLQRAISVQRGRRESTLTVAVSHREPEKAHVAVNAVLASLERHLFDPTDASATAQERTLSRREADLESRIDTLRGKITDVTNGYGADAIEEMYAEKVRELIEIEEELNALSSVGEPATPDPENAAAFSRSPLVASITAYSEELERIRLEMLAKLEGYATRYGPSHRVIQDLEGQIRSIGIQIELCERSLADGSLDLRHSGIAADELATIARTRNRRIVADLERKRDDLRGHVDALAPQRTRVAELTEQAQELTKRLWETRRRLDEIRVEAEREDRNRVSVASRGDLPVTPASDRRLPLAAAGALFGAASGLALVVLIGLVDPRVRYLEELERLELGEVLALLPEIDDGDVVGTDRAREVVDRLCGQLDLREREAGRIIRCVTSAERDEGRTSVALSLARSFAELGRRTLIIDADAGRAGLTSALGLASAHPIGGARGAHDLDRLVHPTGQDRLWAIPFGCPRGIDSGDLSRKRLAALLAALRNEFDAIVIDAGPILDSAEACVVAAEADDVVMVVGRNRPHQRLRTSIERLARADVDCAGLVFNRAAASDAVAHVTEVTATPVCVAPFASGGRLDASECDAPPSPISIDRFRPADSDETTESDSWKRAA